MARAPVPGRTKTRLEPLLGPRGCARLQAELVRHTAAVANRVAPGAVFVAAAGDRELLRPLVPAGVHLFAQRGDDLGARMAHGCRRVRASRSGPILVIGTDCPALGAEHLTAALDRLVTCDVVFGPALDGGYYLVAHDLADPAVVFGLPPAAWGGPDVLERSLAATHAAGLDAALIDPERDLDTPADAALVRSDPRTPPGIADLLVPVPAA